MAHFFVPLLTAHLLVDFLLLPPGASERDHWTRWAIHGGSYAAIGYLLLGRWDLWWAFALLLAFDLLLRLPRLYQPSHAWTAFAADQLAHLAGLAALAGVMAGPMVPASVSTWLDLWGWDYTNVLAVVAGALAAIWAGSMVIGYGVQPFVDELQQARAEAKPPQTPLGLGRGFALGGKRIGQLERALIYLFILVGEPTAIGFLIAAKSVFRIGELREGANRMEAEYILIGTLMSFLFGLLVAYLTKAYLGR
jgi:hypothetical protein